MPAAAGRHLAAAAAAAAGRRLHSCRPPPRSEHENHARVVSATPGPCLSRPFAPNHGLRCVASPELGTQLPAAIAKRSAVIPDSDQRASCAAVALQPPLNPLHQNSAAASRLWEL